MRRCPFLCVLAATWVLVGCSPPPAKVRVIEHPPPDWTLSTQGFRDVGCEGTLGESCAELIALGCDEVRGPDYRVGGLQPRHAVMECIHSGAEPPNREYFKQKPGLDARYRSYVVFQDGRYRLIAKRSEFRGIFAPVESEAEALSYAMVLTALSSRYDLDPQANVEYLVDVVEETYAEQTADGYLVYLFDWDRRMGCGVHSHYAVKVLVTRDGDVQEVERREIYRQQACTDFGVLTLDDD